MTIVRTSADKIIGGFNGTDWDSSGTYKADPSTFLFSVDLKQKFIPNQQANLTLNNNSYGPFFGSSSDLVLGTTMLNN